MNQQHVEWITHHLQAFPGVRVDQVLSLRNIVIKDKIISRHAVMNANIARMSAAYDTTDIVTLSRRFDFPPLGLLRGILLHRGAPKGAMRDVFAHHIEPDFFLKGRDLQQFELALANDAESAMEQAMVAAVAAENELRFVEHFRGMGVRLLTQDDLTAQQVREHGRAILTPDLLFEDPVVINGHPVRWIDYKDYLGTAVGFLFKSNAAQAAKYHAKWGPGAMCFRRGFVHGLTIPGCIVVDGETCARAYAAPST